MYKPKPYAPSPMARNLVYYAQLLRDHPLLPTMGESRESAGTAA